MSKFFNLWVTIFTLCANRHPLIFSLRHGRITYEKSSLPKPTMNQAIAQSPEPVDLALTEPLPLTQHPAEVYLSQLAPLSRRTMRQSLNAIASMLTSGQCDAMTLDWSKLRYQHTAALAAVFRDKYAPATANRMLSALRRVLKEARRLKQMFASRYKG